MQPTTLNPIQLRLLQMFNYSKDEKRLEEMRDVLLKHIQNKVDEEGERLWIERGMTNEMIHELKNAHFRTPYKYR